MVTELTRQRRIGIWLAREGGALLPLRLLVGVGFVVHGYAKLSRGPAHFADIVAALGLPAPHALAWATTVVELVGGLALIAGAFVRPISVALSGVMLTAIIGVHWAYGFSSIRLIDVTDTGAHFGPVGYEAPLLYIAALTTLAISGPSAWSVDGRHRAEASCS